VRFECDCTPTTGLSAVFTSSKNLLVGDYIRAMNAPDFSAWVRRRDDQRRGHVPYADRIVPLVAGAGQTGMTRRQLGHAVPLAPVVLDQLLDALVRFGSLTAASADDTVVYRTAQRVHTRLALGPA